MPSNPGWPFGYVPTPAEWAAAFGDKVDYVAPVNQGGSGVTTAPGANYVFQQRRLINTGPTLLAPLSFNGILTSFGPITLFPPLLVDTLPGDWIDIADVEFNANVNNITLTASAGNQISLFGSSATSQTLNVAGVQARLVRGPNIWYLLV